MFIQTEMITVVEVLNWHKLTTIEQKPMATSIIIIFPFSLLMFAGTTEQVDTLLCNKHKRAKQQTLQSL